MSVSTSSEYAVPCSGWGGPYRWEEHDSFCLLPISTMLIMILSLPFMPCYDLPVILERKSHSFLPAPFSSSSLITYNSVHLCVHPCRARTPLSTSVLISISHLHLSNKGTPTTIFDICWPVHILLKALTRTRLALGTSNRDATKQLTSPTTRDSHQSDANLRRIVVACLGHGSTVNLGLARALYWHPYVYSELDCPLALAHVRG